MAYNLLAWNCQGASNPTTLDSIKNLISMFQISVLMLFETKVSGRKAEDAIKCIGMKNSHCVEAAGFAGGIWVLWNEPISLTVVQNNWQFLHFKIVFPNNITACISAVYGSPQPLIRRQLWEDLNSLAEDVTDPWLVVGDFNAFLEENDKVGGRRLVVKCLKSGY